jgi:hypothetical protein
LAQIEGRIETRHFTQTILFAARKHHIEHFGHIGTRAGTRFEKRPEPEFPTQVESHVSGHLSSARQAISVELVAHQHETGPRHGAAAHNLPHYVWKVTE